MVSRQPVEKCNRFSPVIFTKMCHTRKPGPLLPHTREHVLKITYNLCKFIKGLGNAFFQPVLLGYGKRAQMHLYDRPHLTARCCVFASGNNRVKQSTYLGMLGDAFPKNRINQKRNIGSGNLQNELPPFTNMQSIEALT